MQLLDSLPDSDLRRALCPGLHVPEADGLPTLRPTSGCRSSRRPCCGAGLVTLFSEALSPLHLLNRTGLAAVWGVTAIGLLAWAYRRGAFSRPAREAARLPPSVPAADGILLVGLALVAALLLVVAWIAPPNNVDSLLYHMARVVHWAEDKVLSTTLPATRTNSSCPPGPRLRS